MTVFERCELTQSPPPCRARFSGQSAKSSFLEREGNKAAVEDLTQSADCVEKVPFLENLVKS
jgi:hypothetical protein